MSTEQKLYSTEDGASIRLRNTCEHKKRLGVWKNEKIVMYLKTEINLDYVYSFVSYNSVNTLYLDYRNQ
jgi:hypothetical protein